MKKLILSCLLALISLANNQNLLVPANHGAKPSFSQWPKNYNNGKNDRYILGEWIINGCWDSCKYNITTRNDYEYEGYDGWYNNIADPDLGAIDKPLLRRWPAAYEDGSYLPSGSKRPNPLVLSEELLKGDVGTKSKTGKNALLVFFGQQIVEEILDAQRPACPPEYFNIPIPENHLYRINQPHHTELPVLRSRYSQKTGFSPNNPRQQLNEITPFIDGGLFYGITKQWSDQLRTYENGTIDPDGRLASSHDGLFPAYNIDRLPMANPPPPFYHATFIKNHETDKVSRFFKLGNPRGNENSFLLTFGIIWFRWHNYLAKTIRKFNPNWSSDRVFNEARKWVIGTQQKIYIYDWLPAWVLKSLPPYEKYDPSINPQIDQFFQAAAFRFGHTLVVPGVYLRDHIRNGCKSKFETWGHNTVRTCNSFWRPHEPIVTKNSDNSSSLIDIDRLLMGMGVQLSEKEDHKIIEDLRENVFGPLEFPRRDLMALNIQRGRDHGLPDFNTAREAFGLPRVGFSHFHKLDPKVLQKFKELHNNSVNDIDPWVGGILETDNGPGEFFKTVILDQFRRIRDGDRFWFENPTNKLFTNYEIKRIHQLTLYDILMAVTKMDHCDIPFNPFSVALTIDEILIKNCHLKQSNCTLKDNICIHCFHLEPLTQDRLNETCVQGDSYDYFNNSELSYISSFSGIGVFIIGTIGVIYFLIRKKEEKIIKCRIIEDRNTRLSFENNTEKISYPLFVVHEWIDQKLPSRTIAVVLKEDMKQIVIMSPIGIPLRVIDFSSLHNDTKIYKITDFPYIIIKCEHNYDLVIQFESNFFRNNFLEELEKFLSKNKLKRQNITTFNLSNALKKVVTKEERQKRLEKFFRVVFAQAFKIKHSVLETLKVDAATAKEIVYTELTINEFADALNMRSSDEFVKRMFSLVDKDKNGFISFREFIDLLIIFANGTEEEKAKLLFNMYDINATGNLTEENFVNMIKSFLATVGGTVEECELKKIVKTMMSNAGIQDKNELSFEDFKKMVGDDIHNLKKAKLGFEGTSTSNLFLDKARNTIENIYSCQDEVKTRFEGMPSSLDRNSAIIDEEQEESIKKISKTQKKPQLSTSLLRYIELRCREIFWISLYTLVLLAIFAERAYYYSVEREHSGLRRIAGYGVTITRGAASAMMFTYSSLLITMCRNSITYLRSTNANKYFPFDSLVEFHKYIAIWALIFTVLHIIGHSFNFYHISTQTADDLTCLFRNYFHATHELPKFHYWFWQTMTGITGFILTIICIVIYVFAQNIVRQKIYNWFWYTHNLYPLFFIFMILHGTGRLIQPPFIYYFLLAPVIIFTVDMLISVNRKKIELPVLRAEIFPSNVTMLEFRKPEDFQYKSGQWIRIACLSLNANEYHPFTLSSSPQDDTLTVHIRAVGPWTTNIRSVYDNTLKDGNIKFPKLYVDGPYGEAHEDWNNFDVSVLIGGGIGVTPFASILKDIIQRSNNTRCKKVYFIWVSRTQKQFEWLVDIIREVEYKDRKNIISCHIFITQFYEKFDLRTILLYICERHYQRISNRSLFTNLRAVTHFGRPSFPEFFETMTTLHTNAKSFGIFSCGPPSMTKAVDRACNKMNINHEQKFEHYYKNF